ncbi:hypothetical protein MNBD_NITROSPINAE02-245 [hydrothermal vent metagenome]|uniref:histidine kinase n=1 Tax=hydrothermal vent metagenome TaxID=652676 RepID=A0A3B1D804_9ZZZZ
MSKRRATDRLSVRINALILIFIFLPATLVVFHYKNRLDVDLKREITAEIAGQVKERADRIISAFEFSTVKVSSAVEHINVFVNTNLEESMKLVSGPPSARFFKSVMHNNLVADLKTELKSSDQFLQYRLINTTGDEIIRIERRGEDVVELPIDKLRNRGDKLYFKHILENVKPGPHVMRPTLARVDGKIATPRSLIFRIGKQVTLKNGKPLGIIVLDVSANLIFGSELSEKSSGFLVIDEEGTYLHHWDEKVLYGKDLGLSANILKEEPELKINLDKQDSRIHWDPELKEYRLWRKVFYMPHTDSKYIVLLKRIQESQVMSPWGSTIDSAGMAILLIAILSMVAIFVAMNRELRPLNQLVKSIKRFEIGELTARANITTRTEIGEIGKAFNDMAEKLESNINRITLLHEIAEEANSAASVFEVMQKCLEKVCAHTGWGIGHVYFPNSAGVCVSSEIWHSYNPEEFKPFIDLTRKSSFPPGIGLPGRVFQIGSPVWIERIDMDSNFPRQKVADEIGIQSGFAFPALEGDKVVAVLEFYSIKRVEPQKMTLDLVKHLGVMLGRVTERKRAENSLRIAHGEITSKAAQLAQANSELTEYAYVVSHDLKAPLRAIRTYAQFLSKDLEGKLQEKQKLYIENLNEAVRDGSQMIDDLLALSQIDKTPEPGVTINLEELLLELVSSLGLPDNVVVKLPKSKATVYGTPVLLRQIFLNLISNAVKFNESGNIAIEVDIRSAGSGHIEISVSDNGIGIEPHFFDKIFKVFERLHSSDEYEGTGIGLAIVRKAVIKSNGSIRVESELGKGATFFINLPGAL